VRSPPRRQEKRRASRTRTSAQARWGRLGRCLPQAGGRPLPTARCHHHRCLCSVVVQRGCWCHHAHAMPTGVPRDGTVFIRAMFARGGQCNVHVVSNGRGRCGLVLCGGMDGFAVDRAGGVHHQRQVGHRRQLAHRQQAGQNSRGAGEGAPCVWDAWFHPRGNTPRHRACQSTCNNVARGYLWASNFSIWASVASINRVAATMASGRPRSTPASLSNVSGGLLDPPLSMPR
jgi:hypothetical protein